MQYAKFTAMFNNVLSDYVQSINEESTGKVSVMTTVTDPYTTPSSVIQVADASVFGPAGTYSSSIAAQAVFGTVSFGTFTLIGSSGNNLIIDVALSKATNLPVGTVLTANVSTSALTSAMAIFPSYITDSTTQLATNLVRYFNNLPVELPPKNTPPYTPAQGGAIQSYVYQNIAGATATSLEQMLLAIPLPTTAGSDLDIYEAAVDSEINQSRQQILDGVMQIFNRRLLINVTSPGNRLGENFNSSSTSSTSGSTGSTSSTSSTTA